MNSNFSRDLKKLNHPTGAILENCLDSKDYLAQQLSLIEKLTSDFEKGNPVILYGVELSRKEVASLFHQRDLLHVVTKNPEFEKQLKKINFDFSSYLRGSFDSDMGKLKIYQELLTTPSEKSDLLFNFLKGKGPEKSWSVLKEIFETFNREKLPFINPNISNNELRGIIKRHPVLLGYYHEFPGMIDAVLAFERGILTKVEFKNQILVNLGHSGPEEGYWKFLQKVLLPKLLSDEPDLFPKLFKGTHYLGTDGHIHYFEPTSLESFVSTFFDRMSQATRGGYLKIDFEVNGDPIKSVSSLLLHGNNEDTQKQLLLLRDQLQKSRFISVEGKKFVFELINSGLTYLRNFQSFLLQRVKFKEISGGHQVEVGQDQVILFQKIGDKFLFQGKISDQENVRKELHKALIPQILEAEKVLGDPFHDIRWK